MGAFSERSRRVRRVCADAPMISVRQRRLDAPDFLLACFSTSAHQSRPFGKWPLPLPLGPATLERLGPGLPVAPVGPLVAAGVVAPGLLLGNRSDDPGGNEWSD